MWALVLLRGFLSQRLLFITIFEIFVFYCNRQKYLKQSVNEHNEKKKKQPWETRQTLSHQAGNIFLYVVMNEVGRTISTTDTEPKTKTLG